MKKKEWYNLLNEYNDLVKAKEYNKAFVDADNLDTAKGKILHYLQEEAGIICEADAQGYAMSLAKMGLHERAALKAFSDSWVVKWARKAENIISAVKEERTIEETDIKESYYGMRFLDGRVDLKQYLLILAACGMIILIVSLFAK